MRSPPRKRNPGAGSTGAPDSHKINSNLPIAPIPRQCKPPAARFTRRPEPIAFVGKGASARVEIVLTTRGTASFVDVRVATRSGPLWFPSGDGFVLSLAKLPSLIQALRAAEQQARERGLLNGADVMCTEGA